MAETGDFQLRAGKCSIRKATIDTRNWAANGGKEESWCINT